MSYQTHVAPFTYKRQEVVLYNIKVLGKFLGEISTVHRKKHEMVRMTEENQWIR